MQTIGMRSLSFHLSENTMAMLLLADYEMWWNMEQSETTK